MWEAIRWLPTGQSWIWYLLWGKLTSIIFLTTLCFIAGCRHCSTKMKDNLGCQIQSIADIFSIFYFLSISFAILIREILLLEHIGQVWIILLSLLLFLLSCIPDLKTVALQKHTLQIANWYSELLYVHVSVGELLWDVRVYISQVKTYHVFLHWRNNSWWYHRSKFIDYVML